MKILGIIVFLVLMLIAAIHVYWALGGLWPMATELDLINMVIGAPDMTKMPSPAATLGVAILIFIAALAALAVSGSLTIAPRWLAQIAAAGAGFVFLARGVAGFFFEHIAWTPVEPFATMNRWYYSPLCLVIGASFFLFLFSLKNSNRDIQP